MQVPLVETAQADPMTKPEQLMALRERKLAAMQTLLTRIEEREDRVETKMKDWLMQAREWVRNGQS